MKKIIFTAAVLCTAIFLGAADLRIATAKIRAAEDEKTLNAAVTGGLKKAQNDDEKASLLTDAAIRANELKLYALAAKLYGDAAALPKVSAPLKARAMEMQAEILIRRLNKRVEGVEAYKKILAMNVPGYEHKINNAIAFAIYYGGKGFNRNDAIPYFEATLKYPNNNGMFFVVRNRIENKKLAEARAILEKAKKQPKPSRNFFYDLTNAEGELLCAEGKYDASIAAYRKLDQINPRRHYTHVWYQYTVYRASKNKAKAVEMLKELQKDNGWKKQADNEQKNWEKVK